MVVRKKKKAQADTLRLGRSIALLGVLLLSVSLLTSKKITQVLNASPEWGGGMAASTRLRSETQKEIIPFEPVNDYAPSYSESFVLDHAQEMGYKNDGWVTTCGIWNSDETYPELHQKLTEYASDLESYSQAIGNFQPVPNVLETIRKTGTHEVCKSLRLHPEGLKGLFPSGQLSLSRGGFVEPMLPPFRSHKVCQAKYRNGMNLDYLVHDFETMCLQLKPTSKIILLDMGASLAYHGGARNPMLEVMQIYEKFGFHFDHIYALEVTPLDPNKVFSDMLPEKYLTSYHWMNTGVTVGESDKMNPLHSIVKQLDEDDLVIVKLDIDTPSLELPLVRQLVKGGDDGIYHRLVDHFYFEHHIYLKDMEWAWGEKVNGTVYDSLDIFTTLRQKGIASHSWP